MTLVMRTVVLVREHFHRWAILLSGKILPRTSLKDSLMRTARPSCATQMLVNTSALSTCRVDRAAQATELVTRVIGYPNAGNAVCEGTCKLSLPVLYLMAQLLT